LSESDWIELYNPSTVSADLSSYRIRDNTARKRRDLEGSIEPGGFLEVGVSNYLNKDGDAVRLLLLTGGAEEPVDTVSYGQDGDACLPECGQTVGRFPDGSGNLVLFTTGSRGMKNQEASSRACPGPTESIVPTRPMSATEVRNRTEGVSELDPISPEAVSYTPAAPSPARILRSDSVDATISTFHTVIPTSVRTGIIPGTTTERTVTLMPDVRPRSEDYGMPHQTRYVLMSRLLGSSGIVCSLLALFLYHLSPVSHQNTLIV
jgi:hypothetical protein